jgi:glycosyltransferase involved in cell wall biosynthesis
MAKNVLEPLVSIIIPIYNAEKYLEESLGSVLNQTYGYLEILCVNDGSTDGSVALLEKFQQTDGRIRILSQKNQGAGVARNLGMDEAKGEFIYFFDADDLLHKKAIETLVKAAIKQDTDIVLFGYYRFNEDKKSRVDFSAKTLKVRLGKVISPRDIADRLYQADHGMPWNKLYKAEFLRKTGVKFQALKNTNDEFFSRITTVEADRILFLNKTFVGYRVGNAGSLQGKANRHILDCTAALEAIREELVNRGYYEMYSDTFKKLAGYVVMLKLISSCNSDSFEVLAREVSENTIDRCEMDEEHLEKRYRNIFKALKAKDISKAEYEINNGGLL